MLPAEPPRVVDEACRPVGQGAAAALEPVRSVGLGTSDVSVSEVEADTEVVVDPRSMTMVDASCMGAPPAIGDDVAEFTASLSDPLAHPDVASNATVTPAVRKRLTPALVTPALMAAAAPAVRDERGVVITGTPYLRSPSLCAYDQRANR